MRSPRHVGDFCCTNASKELDFGTLQNTCASLINAGSETTATVLAGVTYLLLQHPLSLERLTQEVRSAFNQESEITFNSVQHLPFMLACLNEALRIYPPVSVGLPRCVPAGGAVIAEQLLPEEVSCHMPYRGLV